jgi:hypothetical protein
MTSKANLIFKHFTSPKTIPLIKATENIHVIESKASRHKVISCVGAGLSSKSPRTNNLEQDANVLGKPIPTAVRTQLVGGKVRRRRFSIVSVQEGGPCLRSKVDNTISFITAFGIAKEAKVKFELSCSWNECRTEALIIILGNLNGTFFCGSTEAIERVVDVLSSTPPYLIAVTVLEKAIAIVRAHLVKYHGHSILGTTGRTQVRLPNTNALLLLFREQERDSILLVCPFVSIVGAGKARNDIFELTHSKAIVYAIAGLNGIVETKGIRRAINSPGLTREIAIVRIKRRREAQSVG